MENEKYEEYRLILEIKKLKLILMGCSCGNCREKGCWTDPEICVDWESCEKK